MSNPALLKWSVKEAEAFLRQDSTKRVAEMLAELDKGIEHAIRIAKTTRGQHYTVHIAIRDE